MYLIYHLIYCIEAKLILCTLLFFFFSLLKWNHWLSRTTEHAIDKEIFHFEGKEYVCCFKSIFSLSYVASYRQNELQRNCCFVWALYCSCSSYGWIYKEWYWMRGFVLINRYSCSMGKETWWICWSGWCNCCYRNW